MSSIIPGFEYDIFISYRQKDNKGDRWVSEFVASLRTELESTFKEDIGVYFDINQHDGLLETHDVDASLKEKLRCLIFIPIISRTYCDPKSFAWEHEFRTFLELAAKDQFGMKVRLPNGNVASRILPVQIHYLDKEDESLIAGELGGVIRAIEFIYREPGVNKPLSAADNDKKNLNGTRYNIQVNKVANAVAEIIRGLKASINQSPDEKPAQIFSRAEAPAENENLTGKIRQILKKIGWLRAAMIFAVLAAISLLVILKAGKHGTLDKLRQSGDKISVAVMPFRNMTNDTTMNVWQDGIQFNLIASLSNSADLRVKQTEAVNDLLKSKGVVNYASITPSLANTISRNLDANIYIYGNINEAGGKIRLNAQLIDSKTEEAFKSFQADGNISDILKLTDTMSVMIRNFLIFSTLKKEISQEFHYSTPNSIEAYKAFIMGFKAYYNYDIASATKFFSQAIQIDSSYLYAYFWISMSYADQGLYPQADKWSMKLYSKKDQLTLELKIWANFIYAKYHERSKTEELKYARQLLGLDDQVPLTHWAVGLAYYDLHQYNNAIPELEATLNIYKSWDTKPLNSAFYLAPVDAYQKTGRYNEEKELLKKAMSDFPNDLRLTKDLIILQLTLKDTIAAAGTIEDFLRLEKDEDKSEAESTSQLADIYSAAGIPGTSEKYYRKAVALEPDNPVWLNNLAYFLIETRNNPEEGLSLADKALRIRPDNYLFLDTRGWGLYKMGKYKEALKLLERSWDLRPVYNYTLSEHLDKAKKAVAAIR